MRQYSYRPHILWVTQSELNKENTMTKQEETRLATLLETGELLKQKLKKLRWEQEDILWLFETTKHLPDSMKNDILHHYKDLQEETEDKLWRVAQDLSEWGVFL